MIFPMLDLDRDKRTKGNYLRVNAKLKKTFFFVDGSKEQSREVS